VAQTVHNVAALCVLGQHIEQIDVRTCAKLLNVASITSNDVQIHADHCVMTLVWASNWQQVCPPAKQTRKKQRWYTVCRACRPLPLRPNSARGPKCKVVAMSNKLPPHESQQHCRSSQHAWWNTVLRQHKEPHHRSLDRGDMSAKSLGPLQSLNSGAQTLPAPTPRGAARIRGTRGSDAA
jgi:hypothetical protein